ncbi:MAG TPA: alpha-glucan family phosphorylase [Candidatus Acidoferrum sp.]|nr:alpha-glucan family phosphorylase [Candidatus Acidoferrum sp.]
MKPVSTFTVQPALPEALRPLLRIAYNLRWSWDHAAIDLFRRLDRDGWERCNRNPVLLLGTLQQSILDAAAADPSFLAHQRGVAEKLDNYVSGEGSWYSREHREQNGLLVAYFSAEFGITECVTIFAGGLGVLAGDLLKASSDLGLPLVGVGLLYQQGYFRQYLNAAGWQQEAFEKNDFHTWPIQPIPNVVVRVQFPDGMVTARVWKANVGRIQLYLLDTDVPENSAEHRTITNQLYGGDLEARLRQEILLGIGGYRMLDGLGLRPTVFHMNEGHSGFLALEHVQRLMENRHLSFDEARQLASSSLIFTTHTPVPAGHDYFSSGLMGRYFSSYWERLGISRDEFLGLGRQNPGNGNEEFCMTVLALRLASFSNGVSRLHGQVSRAMWSRIWDEVPEQEIPISHVTNGVHFRTWVSNEMNHLYDRYLGPKWREEPADANLWKQAESIPAAELWRTHERRRERLVSQARHRLREQLLRCGASRAAVDAADEVLNPEALTIGFGRRFASYKRATLLLRDPNRLARILNDACRPVQIIYAGKAHPKDHSGKGLIKTIVDLAATPEFRRKMVFLENYDMAIARHMVQGCDVWLNTPLRPEEASGTSGMKALANGVLNVSTLDGWWDEAWSMGRQSGNEVGWAIGNGEMYSDRREQDQVEADALYDLLEHEIVPEFYERRADGIPAKWVARMKRSISTLGPEFNMHRMVVQYVNNYYVVAHGRFKRLENENAARTRNLAAWLTRVQAAWPGILVESAERSLMEIHMGEQVSVTASVFLNGLSPDDVRMEILTGPLNGDQEMTDITIVPMCACEVDESVNHVFIATLRPSGRSGLHGYAVRILPRHEDILNPFIPGMIAWARSASPVAELQLR